ncbi:MAG TPA: aldehyde dehydrogenase family protein, partial [Microthrixaceae bacterium]|nr:aldehyde dehydrogenase family protein [Microthrixaceae bacterium]
MTPGDPTFNATRSAGGFADYSPALENRRRVVIREVYAHVIDGAFVPSASSKTLTVVEPATGESLAEVASGNAADVDLAVRAARRAFDRLWNDTDPLERGRHLFRLSQVIRRRCREFSVLGAIESGRPVRWLRETDGPAAVAQIFHFAGWADKFDGAVHNPPARSVAVAMVEPLGVMGILAPPGRHVAIHAVDGDIEPAAREPRRLRHAQAIRARGRGRSRVRSVPRL